MQEEMTNRLIGNNIRAMRNARCISRQELADRLSISYQQVQKYETGMNAVSPHRLAQLAEIFSCAVEDFFHAAHPPHRSSRYLQCSPLFHRSKQVVKLMHCFERIDSPSIRFHLYRLVESIADRAS